MGFVSRLLRPFRREPARESVEWSIPDPGLGQHNLFRQWLGIYALIDKQARARGGNIVDIPTDDRMLFIARGLMRYNPYAQGFISALRMYVLGSKGLRKRFVGKSAAACQKFLDQWLDDNDFWSWEREIYERVHIEGGSVTRFFDLEIRPVELEWILAPDGTDEWTFGFRNKPGDVHTIEALHARYGAENYIVEADDFYHVKSKLSVKADKRGRSDFLATAALFDDSIKTWRNFTQSEAVRQSIIYFTKQAEGVTSTDLEAAIASQADYRPPATAIHQPPVQLVRGAGVEHLQAGTELAKVPGAENVSGTMQGINAGLLAATRPYHMPVVLVTGDMMANNTLDLSDESPFAASIADEQNWYSRHVRNLLWRIVEIAVDLEELPPAVLEDGTDLQVEPENKPANRDAKASTDRLKILHDDGIISKRTWAKDEGYDYDDQQADTTQTRLPGASSRIGLNGSASTN